MPKREFEEEAPKYGHQLGEQEGDITHVLIEHSLAGSFVN